VVPGEARRKIHDDITIIAVMRLGAPAGPRQAAHGWPCSLRNALEGSHDRRLSLPEGSRCR